MVRWLVRLRIRVARPMARGRKRLIVGPASAYTARILRSSPTSSWLFSALATADSSSLLQASATARGWKARIERASATVLPRMPSHTRRDLRGEERTYLAWARTITVSPATRPRRRERVGAGAGAAGFASSFFAAGFRFAFGFGSVTAAASAPALST